MNPDDDFLAALGRSFAPDATRKPVPVPAKRTIGPQPLNKPKPTDLRSPLHKKIDVAANVARELPFVGEGASAADALTHLGKGELGKAGLAALFAIPALGEEGRAGKNIVRAVEHEIHPEQRAENLYKLLKGSEVQTPQFHGTRGDFSTFNQGDLGLHVGTPEHANARVDFKPEAMMYPAERQGGWDIVNPLEKDPSERWAMNAYRHSGQSIMPLHTRITNPVEMEDWGNWSRLNVEDQLGARGILPKPQLRAAAKEAHEIEQRLLAGGTKPTPEHLYTVNAPFREAMKREGIDGVKYRNQYEFYQPKPTPDYSYIAFDPNQLKSVTGNRGTFDLKNPNILYGGLAGLFGGGAAAASAQRRQGNGLDPMR